MGKASSDQDFSERVVSGYIAGQPMLELLAAIPEPRQPAIEAMLALRRYLGGQRDCDEAIRLAEAAMHEPADPNLILILCEMWTAVCHRLHRMGEAEALIRHARSLVGRHTLPEVLAGLMASEAAHAGMLGDKKRREEINRQALEMLPSESPRRKIIAWDRAMHLACMGRLSEVADDIAWLERIGFPASRVALTRFSNACETLAIGSARSLIGVVESDRSLADFAGGVLENGRALLVLASGEPAAGEESAWVRSTRQLLAGDAVGALRSARQATAGEAHFSMVEGFHGYCLVRVELSSGHGEAGRRLLLQRRAAGNEHYLDDFFLARADWLAGDRESAARHFAAAAKACEFYGAERRLEFELQLSGELTAEAVFVLARKDARAGRRVAETHPADSWVEPRGADRLIGPSEAMEQVRESVRKLAALDVPVLITGETGTGKELVARALHEAGPDAGEPFLAINCGAIAETLLESELFGHEKGAFTGAQRAHRGVFEEAGRGTVFLDEIGEVSVRLQAALLRVLEAGEIRPVGSATSRMIACRILAATNADLDDLVEKGAFRKDLLYRLRRLEVGIPPLRRRPEDIVPLARHYLALGRRDGDRATMTPELESMLELYGWPGNVRELRNEIERMRLLNSDRLDYDVEHVSLALATMPPPAVSVTENVAGTVAALPSPAAPAGGTLEADPLHGNSVMRRLERLRGLFARHGKLTRAEAVRLFGVTGNTATALMKRLVAEGLIEKVEPTKSPRTHYFRVRSSGE